MSADLGALIGAAGAIVGVVVGAGLQYLQTRRTERSQERAAERLEMRNAGVAYLIDTWQLVTYLTGIARRPTAAMSEEDRLELGRLVRAATESRTQLDLVCTAPTYAATKRYHWRLLNAVRAAEHDQLQAGVDYSRTTVEERRALMNRLRSDLGREAVLRRWSPDTGDDTDAMPESPYDDERSGP